MEIDLVKNISTLTSIKEKYVDKIIDKEYYIINDGIINSLMNNETVASFNMGIGTLHIQIIENNIRYKFIPSEHLEDTVKSTVINKQNLLESVVEDTLISKIENMYKELI